MTLVTVFNFVPNVALYTSTSAVNSRLLTS